jgi:hypothetical protein
MDFESSSIDDLSLADIGKKRGRVTVLIILSYVNGFYGPASQFVGETSKRTLFFALPVSQEPFI